MKTNIVIMAAFVGFAFGQQATTATGKEAAFQAWVAQGGILPGDEARGRGGRKPGVFVKGPMKGMTMAQARQRFEVLWEKTPASVKERYRKREVEGILPVPSEKPQRAAGESEADRKFEEIRRQQQEAERKRQEMERQAEHERRKIQRQQEEIERRQREIERQQREAELDE